MQAYSMSEPTYGHKTRWKLWADLWNGDQTFAEKTLTPLTIEPYQACVFLIDSIHPTLPQSINEEAHEPSTVCIYIKGGSIMLEAAVSPLPTWQNFYVIIGTAAATLTGLMFVAITLIARMRDRRSNEAVEAFSSPTVVHFCTALLVAAILSAPWQALWNAGLLLGLAGLGGVTYAVIVVLRARRQADYQLVVEDWLWYTAFPLVSYIAFVVAAILLSVNAAPALFVIAAATLLLLFTGIHNAWDTVTYVAIYLPQPENTNQD